MIVVQYKHFITSNGATAYSMPFSHRIQSSPQDHEHFHTKWLTMRDPSYHSLFIVNGWQAEAHYNQWYADALETLNTFAFDSRGQGRSPKSGRLDAVQNAIDTDVVLRQIIEEQRELAIDAGKTMGNVIVEGHCLGTMTLATLYAGRFPLTKQIDGLILLSPVSQFSLPLPIKMTYFLPLWFGTFAIRYIAPTVIKSIAPDDESESSRDNAMNRLLRLDHDAALRQVKDIFWKEDVSKYWKYIDVPCLILVGKHDPLVKFEDSFHPYSQLRYPIWFELEAPDHLMLEHNVELLQEILPEFCEDPWAFYEKYKHRRPKL
ncbi:MAG: alpha/beta fold hydrolase [Candidatus Heimdallarchaeota archaeon]|nr:alpha/beta fold hydrolase [Candidatus Heimdallarchaeota archaeon]